MSDHYERRNRSASDIEIAQRKIFIGGLSYDTTDENLKKYFSVYGTIDDAVVMKDPATKRSRGFGFITFTSTSAVEASLADEQHSIDSRRVEVKRAVPKVEGTTTSVASSPKTPSSPLLSSKIPGLPGSVSTSASLTAKKPSPQLASIAALAGATLPKPAILSPSSNNTASSTSNKSSRSNSVVSLDDAVKYTSEEYFRNKIFVGGLHYDTRDADFKEYFENYGKVLHGEVMFNRETHKSRGFGFIIFESMDSVDRVCEQPVHTIRDKAVEVKRAIPRSQMPPGTTPPSLSTNTNAPVGNGVKATVAFAPTVIGPTTTTKPKTPSLTSSTSTPSITTPIRPSNRRVVSGSTTTVIVGTPVTPPGSLLSKPKPSPIGKPSSSYAAALLAGHNGMDSIMSVFTEVSDLNGSELDATTTIASQSSSQSIYNGDIDLSGLGIGTKDNNRTRAFSEPIVRQSISSDSLGNPVEMFKEEIYTQLSPERGIQSSLGDLSLSTAFETRPSSQSFDNTLSAFSYSPQISRSNTLSPPAGYQRSTSSSTMNESLGNNYALHWSSSSGIDNNNSPYRKLSLSDSFGRTSSSSLTGLQSNDLISQLESGFNTSLSNSLLNDSSSVSNGYGSSLFNPSSSQSTPSNMMVNSGLRNDISWASLVNSSQGSSKQSYQQQPQQQQIPMNMQYRGQGYYPNQTMTNGLTPPQQSQQNQLHQHYQQGYHPNPHSTGYNPNPSMYGSYVNSTLRNSSQPQSQYSTGMNIFPTNTDNTTSLDTEIQYRELRMDSPEYQPSNTDWSSMVGRR